MQCLHDAMAGCDFVFHLAALIAIPYSYQAPESYLDTNVRGTLNVLQAARHAGIEKMVHTSTSEVYGTARSVPINEDHPLQAQSPYAATKIGADQLAISYYRTFGLPVAVIRPFNTYGPRQSQRAVIPAIVTQIAKGKRKIELGSLHPTRDFNYVKDTVEGFLAMAESPSSVGEVVNLGSNFEISIGALVKMIADLMGATVTVGLDPHRLRPNASEVDRLLADNTKAERLLGWKPKYGGETGLSRGLAETIEWFTDEENLKRCNSDLYVI
jgi:dTDP-glucose 4,6-dehydratase